MIVQGFLEATVSLVGSEEFHQPLEQRLAGSSCLQLQAMSCNGRAVEMRTDNLGQDSIKCTPTQCTCHRIWLRISI
jgi:hypothetical protein